MNKSTNRAHKLFQLHLAPLGSTQDSGEQQIPKFHPVKSLLS